MPFSDAFSRKLEQSQRSTVPLLFLELTHADLPKPVRIVRDTVNYKWNGELWFGVMFEGAPISETENQPSVRLTIQNVDRRMSVAASKMRSRAAVHLWMLSSDDFDETKKPRTAVGTPTVEYEASGFFLRDIQITPLEISGELTCRDLKTEPWTRRVANEARCPGLFYGPG